MFIISYKAILRSVICVVFASLMTVPAFGEMIFSGSGTGTGGDPISGTATFDLVMYDFGGGNEDALKITLTNTASSTNLRGNLITGVFFNLSGVGNLNTDSTGFDGLAATVRENASGTQTSSDVDIAPAVQNGATDGTYQLSNGPFGIANSGVNYSAFEYGIATVGMGLSGFQGNATEGDNYGIFAAGTTSFTGGMASALPLIDTSAMFWIKAPEELTDLDQLGDSVRISYGSLPDNFITAIPEPTSLILFGTVIGFGTLLLRRRK